MLFKTLNMSSLLRSRAKGVIFPMSYSLLYDCSSTLLVDSLPGSKQLWASDELKSEAGSNVAPLALFSVSCRPCLAGGSPSFVFSQEVNRLCFDMPSTRAATAHA